MLRIEQALQLYEESDLGIIGINLNLWDKPPSEPKEVLVAQIKKQLTEEVNWESTGASFPPEANMILSALAVWPSVASPDVEDLIATAVALSQSSETPDSPIPGGLRDRLINMIRDLRNIGAIHWIPWHEIRGEVASIYGLPEFSDPTDSTLYHHALYSGAWAQDGWTVPPEIIAALFPQLMPELAEIIYTPANPTVIRSDGLASLYDLIQLLSVANSPGIRVTKRGPLFKRDQEILLSRFLIQDRMSASPGFSRVPDDETPLYLQWLVALADSLILARPDEGRLALTRRTEKWVSSSTLEQLTSVYDLWIRYVAPTEPGLLLALAALLRVQEGRWMDLSFILAWLRRVQQAITRRIGVYQSFYFRDQYRGGIANALAALVYIGALELGAMEEANPMALLLRSGEPVPHSLWARLTPVGRSLLQTGTVTDDDAPPLSHTMAPLIVQPNYEIIVRPFSPPQMHWDLCQIADLVQPDQAYVYRLSRPSILRGLRSGWTSQEILRFLRTGWRDVDKVGQPAENRIPLPQNVEFSIGDWSEGFGKCTVMRVAIVQCESGELADRFLAEGTLKKFAIGRASPTAIVVRDDALKEVIELLEEAGFPPPADPVYLTDATAAKRHGMGLQNSQ